MKPLVPEALFVKVAFQIEAPISANNFSNNISIPHITWCNFWNLLALNLKDKSFHNSIEWSWFYPFRFTVFTYYT